MKITEIRGYHLACELPEVVRNAISRFERRSALVVEVVGDNGMSGWGECTHHPPVVWEFIRSALAPMLLGRDPRLTGALWRRMIGTRGGDIAMMAVSALDMALWDLRARIEGVPIAHLLGGRLRDRVRAYASGPFMQLGDAPYGNFVATVESYLEAGFRAVKPRAGIAPRADAAMVAELRRRLGPDIPVMVDFNRGYARAAALEAICRLDAERLLWIEEPIAPDDLAGYQLLAEKSATPLAAGEALGTLLQFHTLLQAQVVGVLQPDLYLCGGFTGASKIAALAEAAETPYCPHVWGTAINFYASLQLASVLPAYRLGDGIELPMFEWDRSDNALLRIAGEPAIGPDGAIAIPDAPGIGIAIERRFFEPFVKAAWNVAA